MRYVHEVWEDPDDNSISMICRASPWAINSYRLLSARAKVIHTFQAGSHVEASTLLHRIMGWEEYVPLVDSEHGDIVGEEPYPDDWAQNSN